MARKALADKCGAVPAITRFIEQLFVRLAESGLVIAREAGRRLGRVGFGAAKTALDVVFIVVAALWAWLVCFGQLPTMGDPIPFVLCVVVARLPVHVFLGLSQASWRYFSRYDLLRLGISAVLGMLLYALLLILLPSPFTLTGLRRPGLLALTEPAFYGLFITIARLVARVLSASRTNKADAKQVLIVGAGSAGATLAYQIQEAASEYEIAGFLDDDANKWGKWIHGVRVLGPIADVERIASEKSVDQIVVAIPSLTPERLREILQLIRGTGLPVRILPSLHELIDGRVDVKALRPVRMEDLLPRPQIKLDRTALTGYLKGKTVLVTGGGGSIGRELCRQVVQAGAGRVIVLGRGENSVFEAIQELSELRGECELIPAICDVRDRSGLSYVYKQFAPQIVYHAAAHKHVPLMEYYPAEAVKNNIIGTLNTVELAIEHDVERLVFISTDKAVNPVNVMGATKRVAEMIVKSYAAATGANMVTVRFGNVLGSRGSVIPIMQRQIERRLPVTVTDPEMVRYFMTIPEAVELILHAGANGAHGEVFVLNMGHPVRIYDLACELIRLSGLTPHVDIPIKMIGRRPGEKVCEDLFSAEEERRARSDSYFYVVEPEPVDLETLLGHIERLRQAAERHDRAQILEILKGLIPSFHPEPDIYFGSPHVG